MRFKQNKWNCQIGYTRPSYVYGIIERTHKYCIYIESNREHPPFSEVIRKVDNTCLQFRHPQQVGYMRRKQQNCLIYLEPTLDDDCEVKTPIKKSTILKSVVLIKKLT